MKQLPEVFLMFFQLFEVSFRIFQVVASPKVIASYYPRLPTLAPIAQDLIIVIILFIMPELLYPIL